MAKKIPREFKGENQYEWELFWQSRLTKIKICSKF